jgi:hypothetical protein
MVGVYAEMGRCWEDGYVDCRLNIAAASSVSIVISKMAGTPFDVERLGESTARPSLLIKLNGKYLHQHSLH